ncbi:MAG TPA: hypothetical protein VFY84_00855 [Jiangellales bacterium]|nr:hypothetical protein [Jiangellales bacterium]
MPKLTRHTSQSRLRLRFNKRTLLAGTIGIVILGTVLGILGIVMLPGNALRQLVALEPEKPTTSAGRPAATHATAASGNPHSREPRSTSGHPYPDRWRVGAPALIGHRYKQSDPNLPVPAGYTEVWPSDESSKEYDIYECKGTTTIDHKYFHAWIYIGANCHGTINITNSIIAPPPGSINRAILVNSDSSAPVTINISDTTIRPEPVPLGGKNDTLTDHVINACDTCTITMTRVDVANSGGMCLCGENTLVRDSWLHDNYIAHLPDPGVAHTGGIYPYGGSGPVEISHNRLEPGTDAYHNREVPNYWKAITAVLFTQSTGSSVLRNYHVHDNFISMGGYDVFLQDGKEVIFRNNVFGPNYYGHTSTCTNPSDCSVTYADWTGNVTGDIAGKRTGTVVPHP